MIFKKRVLWFQTIRYVLEPWPNLDDLKKKYGAIYILSYDQKDLKDFSVRVKDTPVIYLSKPLEEIFANFHDTTRNEIRKTLDNKIADLEFVIDDKDLEGNYQLSKEFEYQQGRVPERIDAYRRCKLFSARYKKELVVSIICFDCYEVLRAKVICSKRLTTLEKEIRKIISYATRRLVYEICKYGKENSYQLFDLGAVNFAKKNLADFKMSFTKDLIKEYTYTYRSYWFKFFAQGVWLKKMIKKMFKL